jgi:hypothetical protein
VALPERVKLSPEQEQDALRHQACSTAPSKHQRRQRGTSVRSSRRRVEGAGPVADDDPVATVGAHADDPAGELLPTPPP